MNPTQELQQKICQKYGWSAVFSLECEHDHDSSSKKWCVTVTVGMNDKRHFRSDETSKDQKVGMAAASAVAVRELQDEMQRQDAKPVVTLLDVFHNQIPDIYESTRVNWDYFWQHKPTAVGIDIEGNQRCPPVLVQISTEDYVILEVPRKSKGISKDLARLLADESIVKVFCDNNSHNDKKSLGIEASSYAGDLISGHNIVDLEAMSAQLLGPVKVTRGLARILTLCMPELNVLIRKPSRSAKGPKNRFSSVQRFSLIEQGKARELRGLGDLTFEEQQYAALDAWGTLQGYNRLQQHLAIIEQTK